MTKKTITILSIFTFFLASCQSNIDYAKDKIQSGNYDDALVDLENVPSDHEDFNEAQELIKEINKKIEKLDSTSKFEANKILETKISKEISEVDNFDGSNFRTIENIKVELALFQSWSNLIEECASSKDPDLIELSKSFKAKVQRLQVNEFPKMRMRFSKVLKEELWSDNIDVSIGGTANTTLTFTGGVFANNANKQEYQSSLSEIFNLLRFKRIKYKWYKFDDEYTYYTLTNNPDKVLMDL